MSARDKRSQRIREQLRAHANPRSGLLEQRPFRDQLKRLYGESATSAHSDTPAVAAELARIVNRRR